MPRSFRYRPPPIDFDHTIRWVLVRAFCLHRTADQHPVPSPQRALEIAERLDLVARISSQHSAPTLERELGANVAKKFLQHRLASRAKWLGLNQTMDSLVQHAASEGIPFAWMKFSALRDRGVLFDAGRNAEDIDILVDVDLAAEFHRCLVRAGYVPSGYPEKHHQLETLLSPQGVPVEVHRCLRGVRVSASETYATWNELEAAGLLPTTGVPGVHTIELELLAAYIIVHGFVQHGFSPDAYPMARMIADLIDLEVVALSERARRWLSREMTTEELDAVLALAATLARGNLPPKHGQSFALLTHIVAGASSPSYAKSLKLRGVLRDTTDGAVARERWNVLRGALFPTAAQLDKIYGRRLGATQRTALRILRPFDLVIRLARYGASAIALRGDSRIQWIKTKLF